MCVCGCIYGLYVVQARRRQLEGEGAASAAAVGQLSLRHQKRRGSTLNSSDDDDENAEAQKKQQQQQQQHEEEEEDEIEEVDLYHEEPTVAGHDSRLLRGNQGAAAAWGVRSTKKLSKKLLKKQQAAEKRYVLDAEVRTMSAGQDHWLS